MSDLVKLLLDQIKEKWKGAPCVYPGLKDTTYPIAGFGISEKPPVLLNVYDVPLNILLTVHLFPTFEDLQSLFNQEWRKDFPRHTKEIYQVEFTRNHDGHTYEINFPKGYTDVQSGQFTIGEVLDMIDEIAHAGGMD